jgi:hypothetical protein
MRTGPRAKPFANTIPVIIAADLGNQEVTLNYQTAAESLRLGYQMLSQMWRERMDPTFVGCSRLHRTEQ